MIGPKFNLVIYISLFLFIGCADKTFEDRDSLLEYLKEFDNGYCLRKKVNGFRYDLMYKPTDLLVFQELSSEKNYDLHDVVRLRNKYGKYMYITLSISKNNKELLSSTPKNRKEFTDMVHRLVFKMKKSVHLFNQNKDTLEMLDYVYPRLYGTTRSTEILFVYPKDKKYLNNEFLYFTIEDLGNYTGEIKFEIKTNKILNEPSLDY